MTRASEPQTNRDLLDRLRLIRTPSIGPIAFRQLLLRFGSASKALSAIPDLARRGGGRAPSLFAISAAEREMAAVEALGARYLSIGQGLYPRALAELENAPPLITVKGRLDLLEAPMVAIVGRAMPALPPAVLRGAWRTTWGAKG